MTRDEAKRELIAKLDGMIADLHRAEREAMFRDGFSIREIDQFQADNARHRAEWRSAQITTLWGWALRVASSWGENPPSFELQ